MRAEAGSVAALVLGAGQGARLGAGTPKGLVRAAGRRLAAWSALALARAAGVDRVLCVLPAGADLGEPWPGPADLLAPVAGGATRQDSLERGLAALAAAGDPPEWVLVHDAARCLVLPEDAEAVLGAAVATGAAVPVVPLTDTVKEVEGDRVRRTLERARLARVQTPQAFRLDLLLEAVEKARRDGFRGTDCASLVERTGLEVRICPGSPGNFKVTSPPDLERAALVLERRR